MEMAEERTILKILDWSTMIRRHFGVSGSAIKEGQQQWRSNDGV
jgi:hypothetical protein